MDRGASSSFCRACPWRLSSFKISLSPSPIIPILLLFLLVPSPFFCHVRSLKTADSRATNRTVQPEDELQQLKMIRARLKDINKPPVKIIQSPDGDIIDCVLSHQQPAFDHPLLKGQKPLDPPKMPNGHNSTAEATGTLQLWRMSGEACPEGTVPIRRTSEADMLRASSFQMFGKKVSRHLTTDDSSIANEYAIGQVSGDQYYGARASINVWAPYVAEQNEFSLAQLWVVAGSIDVDLNTIEAGWQTYPQLYGDSNPRFFIYWTNDNYQSGCYNLLCTGFVQINNGFAPGATANPWSLYNAGQTEFTLMVYKEPVYGNWWLLVEPMVWVGYWPSVLFTHLGGPASTVAFGGEIVNSSPSGSHTSTQMGSGHFAGEGFEKAAYIRNLQVVNGNNYLIPVQNLQTWAEYPNCYDIQGGTPLDGWGTYFFYGGPGRNAGCP